MLGTYLKMLEKDVKLSDVSYIRQTCLALRIIYSTFASLYEKYSLIKVKRINNIAEAFLCVPERAAVQEPAGVLLQREVSALRRTVPGHIWI